MDRNGDLNSSLQDNIDGTFPARGTWIEIVRVYADGTVNRRTFPARGTWIEMGMSHTRTAMRQDVPRKGNVDRNTLMS